MTRKTTPTNDPTLVEPVRQALVAAMEVRVRRAKTAPLDEVSGLLMEISEIALASRRTLATVQGRPEPLPDLKVHPVTGSIEPEPVQAFGLSGMLTGISETVGTEVFQEFLALARAWLQKNQPLSQWAQVAGLHDVKSPKPTVIDGFTDHDDLDLEALSVRARNLCRMEGFTAKTQIRVRSDEVLLAATKRHSATGRNQPRIVKELREASELAVAASPASSPLTFGSDPAGRRARKVAERAPWWLKSEIRDLSDQAIRYELARQVVTGISRKKVLEALRAAAK